MENIIDLIATDSSASEISDAIKSAIYTKSMDKINTIRPEIASSLFGIDENQIEDEE